MATTTREKFDNIIEIKNVTKVFDGITAVDNVNLAVRRGEFVTLLGPSGCGKTTLLRMIAGFELPTSGTILLEKQDVTTVPPHLRPINTVFQKYALFPHLNVFKNIAFGLKLKRVPTGEFDKKNRPVYRKFTKDEIAEKVERVLKLVNLEAYGYRGITGLSGGQQQRVAIARAIVCEPKVLLLDEPLGALDLKMRKEMQLELAAMHKDIGITFIYVTHDQEEALTMSDKVVVMTDGAVQQYGTPKKIYDEPANAFVADFIGESNILSGVMKKDFLVEFCDTQFKCSDKGFGKDERVSTASGGHCGRSEKRRAQRRSRFHRVQGHLLRNGNHGGGLSVYRAEHRGTRGGRNGVAVHRARRHTHHEKVEDSERIRRRNHCRKHR